MLKFADNDAWKQMDAHTIRLVERLIKEEGKRRYGKDLTYNTNINIVSDFNDARFYHLSKTQ